MTDTLQDRSMKIYNLRDIVHLLTYLYVNVNGIRLVQIHIEICFGPDIIFTALLLSNLSWTFVIASFIATPLSILASIHWVTYSNGIIKMYRYLREPKTAYTISKLYNLRKLQYLYVLRRFQSRKILTYSLMTNPFSKQHFKTP